MADAQNHTVRSFWARLCRRVRGLPVSPRQIDRSLALLGELRALGWHASTPGLPVNRSGEPIPWLTYPAIAWLEQFVRCDHKVFEFGAGQSTLWFAHRTAIVISVETDAAWARRLQGMLPPNASVLIRSTSASTGASGVSTSAYATAIEEYAEGYFDLVLIDGADRAACCRASVSRLSDEGIIVFDNSDRPENAGALGSLRDQGFNRVDFVGFVAGYSHLSCTSVLARRSSSAFAAAEPPRFLGY